LFNSVRRRLVCTHARTHTRTRTRARAHTHAHTHTHRMGYTHEAKYTQAGTRDQELDLRKYSKESVMGNWVIVEKTM
jgi:hypothetical protein